MEIRQTYRSIPLQIDQIRILRLQPGQGGDPLNGQLEAARLDHSADDLKSPDESFEALSYAWGNDSKEHALLIGSQDSLAITASLDSALRRLRLPDRERRLWADAVCINQSDAKEKENQVRFMAEIYRSARVVIADIGDSSEDSDAALDLIDRYWRTSLCHGSDDDEIGRRLSPAETAAFLGLSPSDVDMAWLDHKLPDEGSDEWLPVIHLFQRPWFKRIWVVQEFVLARDVLVYCGTRNIDWRHLFALCIGYDSKVQMTATITNGMLGTEEGIGLEIFSMMAHNRGLRLLQKTPESRRFLESLCLSQNYRSILHAGLVDLLHIYRNSKCTISRDRYFALLSIATNADVLVGRPELQPDYTTADADWNLRMHHFLLQLPDGRDAFMYAGIRCNVEPEAPSRAQRFCPSLSGGAALELVDNDEASRAAGLDSRFIVTADSRDSDLISLLGYRVDEVLMCVLDEEDVQDWSFHDRFLNYFRRVAETYLSTMSVAKMGKKALEDMVTSVAANPDPSVPSVAGVKSLDALVPGLYFAVRDQGFEGPQGWEEAMASVIETEYGFALAETTRGETAESDQVIEDDEDDQESTRDSVRAEVFGAAAYPFLARLNPATTKTGSYANVPQGTSTGDSIWIISGCRLPAVLHPSVEREGMHRLVGFCYASGVMKGEVLDREGFAWQDVLLY